MPARAITASAPPTTTPVSAALDVSSDAFEDAAAAAEVLLISALDEETSFFDVSACDLRTSFLCYLACFLIDLVSWSDMYSYSALCVLVH